MGEPRRTALLVIALVAIMATVCAPAPAQNTFPETARAAQDQYGQPPGSGDAQPTATAAPQSGGEQSRPGGGDDDDSSGPSRGDGSPGGREQGAGNPAGTALPLQDAKGGKLPFTGLDLLALVLLGALLVAAGSALAVVARRRGTNTA